jgi:hypothetical protein
MADVAYEGASIRVVLVDGAEIIEVIERRDAVGAAVWRRVDTSGGLRVVVGWKAIASAAGRMPSQWRMLYNASRRRVRPLAVQYNAFDEPWTYECVIRDWLALGNRPAWAYDLEKQGTPQAVRRRRHSPPELQGRARRDTSAATRGAR